MNSRSRTERAVALLGLAALASIAAGSLAEQPGDAITENELAFLCKQLKADDAEKRWSAALEITGLGKASAGDVVERLGSAYGAKPENMRLVLTGLRKKLKEATIKDLEDRGKKVKIKDLPTAEPPAFLEMLISKRNDNYPHGWRDAVEILTLLGALANMGTTDTIGSVLDHAPAHEAAFRKEIYQIIKWLGAKAIPALVRRQNSKDEHVARVVSTALADMKMERPGQQVQVKDHRILIEVLDAFGDHRNIDALEPAISFINSDMDQVREAAREAILAYGQLALWTLKKEYKEYTGEMPDPDWKAETIAEELFALQDTERMAPLNDRMNKGLELARTGKLEEMEKAFRRILAEQPLYGLRAEMVPGYMAYGSQLMTSGDLDDAALMFKVAERLDGGATHSDAIRARLHLIDGLTAIEEGAPDAHPLRRALELDPELELARETLGDVEQMDRRRRISRYRIMGAVGIGSAALIVLVLLIIRRLD
ncbi:MAG: hypothetical protein JRG91_13245 [Deltaproteobacteria bacterium]|nr:hypothetical protein [Deltaproteobacteria bacterium]